MYHAVEDAVRPPQYKHFYVTKSEFDWQMQALKRWGYTPITCHSLRNALENGQALPPKPVVLTFDDGYANLAHNVHPIMQGMSWPYTVFLVPQCIGKTNQWVEPEGYEPTPLLTWQQIETMASEGFVDFQPHTATHPRLTQIDVNLARSEMRDSRAELEQRLQKPMDILCYPYGNYNDSVVAAAREIGYTMAVTTDFGRARPGDDLMRLPRISVYHVPPVSVTYGIGSLNYAWRLRTRKDTRPAPMALLPD